MAITSGSLVHYTKSLDSLQGILKEGFRIKYCKEEIFTGEGGLRLAVPMVSFCNLPFSQVTNHMKSYGYYGIGLRVGWGRLNPVLYIANNSLLGANLVRGYKRLKTSESKFLEHYSEEEFSIFDTLRYLKNTFGYLVKDDLQSLYNFIDENEWRYVPSNTEAYPFIPLELYLKDKEVYNNSISHLRLKFEIQELTYLIVNDQSEINIMFNFFEEYFPKEKVLLASKLLVAKQVISDF